MTCNDSYVWQWSSPSGWAGLSGVATIGAALYIPANLPALPGQNITLRATLTSSSGLTSSADVTVTAVGSAPAAALSLSVAPGDVPGNAPLVLDATGSRDPDTAKGLQQLTYTWDCRREDSAAPCFNGSGTSGDQITSLGVWSIPAGLLAWDAWHRLTVTVYKQVACGTAPLLSTASVRIRPRATSPAFPTGNLTRPCTTNCLKPQVADSTLTVQLVSNWSLASLAWSSPESPAVANLTATYAAGVYSLAIPKTALPQSLSFMTISATMTSSNGSTGTASLIQALDSVPYCTVNPSNLSACLAAEVQQGTFPNAVVVLRAFGWADAQDAQLQYEFGVRATNLNATGTTDLAYQTGSATAATLTSLPQGSLLLYSCAIDARGARYCGTVKVTVQPPPPDFDPAAALAAMNVSSLLNTSDINVLLPAASQAAVLATALALPFANTPASAASISSAANLVTTRCVALMNASAALLQDYIQGQQFVIAMNNIAAYASPLLTITAQNTLIAAAQSAANAGFTDSKTVSAIARLAAAFTPVALTPAAPGVCSSQLF